MAKSWFTTGSTGSQWLDEAWFTLEIDGQTPVLDNVDRFRQLEKRLMRDRFFSIDSAQMAAARTNIEQGSGRYVWAFPRVWDAIKLIQQRHRDGFLKYQSYEKPASVSEMVITQLYSRFPMNPDSEVKLLIFAGLDICPDPDFSSPRATDFHPVIKMSDWRRYVGFEYGIWLIQPQPEQPVYWLDEAFVQQMWESTMQQKHPNQHPDHRELESPVETALPRMIQQLYRCKPGQ